MRFLASPVELVGDETGHLIAMRLVKNRLVSSPAGTLQPKPTGEMEDLPVGLVFRSVGYKGVPLRVVYRREGLWATSGRALWRRRIPPTQFVIVTRAP